MSVVLVAAVIGLLIYSAWNFVTGKPKNSPPGILRLPLWGSYWFLLWGDYNFPHRTVDFYVQKLKSKIIGCYFGDAFTVIVNDYKSVRELLTRKEFDGRGGDNLIFRARANGKKLGMFFNDDYEWKHQRRFALHNMRNLGFGRRHAELEKVLAEELEVLVETMKNGPINRKEEKVVGEARVFFPDVLSPICANYIWAVMANRRLPRTESGEEHEALRELCKSARTFQKGGDTSGGAVSMTPWLRFFGNLFGYSDYIRGNQGIVNFVKDFMNDLDDLKGSSSEDDQNAFIPTYLREIERIRGREDKSIDDVEAKMFTTEQLVMICTDFMFPALSAVPAVATNCIKYMAHHPEVMKRVQDEIDVVVGTDRLPTWDDRSKLPYTEAVIREVMRIETLTPLSVGHRCTETTDFFGFTIPEDTMMLTNLAAMHSDPDFWGDPENFRPDRFIQDGRIVKDLTLPFGLGRRVCAGETFARFIIFALFTTLVKNFDFEAEEGQPSGLEDKIPGLIVQPRSLWMKFKPRQT